MATSHKSICSTCYHFEKCVLKSNWIIWDCSEFDNEERAHLMPEIQLFESIEEKGVLVMN